MDNNSKENKVKDDANNKDVNFSDNEDYLQSCPTNEVSMEECSSLHYPCISCDRSIDCRYGGHDDYTCTVRPKVVCNVSKVLVC